MQVAQMLKKAPDLSPDSFIMDASSTTRAATEHAAHTLEDPTITRAVRRQQARNWAKSSECQGTVCVLIALHKTCHSELSLVFASQLPSFLMLSASEAFFTALQFYELQDRGLKEAVLQFLINWPGMRLVNWPYSDLSKDSRVQAALTWCVPNYVHLREWIDRRMHALLYLSTTARATGDRREMGIGER